MKSKGFIIAATVANLLSLSISYYNCTSHNEIDIEKELPERISNDIFSFKEIYKEQQWDSLYIMKPYDNVTKYSIVIKKADKSKIKNYSQHNNLCTILFTNKGKLVAYSSVSRGLIDFADLEKIKFAKDYKFSIEGGKARDWK